MKVEFTMKSFPTGVLVLVTTLSLAGNALLYTRYSTSRPLVTVGKDVITKKQYQDQLEQQAGQQVLSKMVFTKLVAQAAARQGVTPTAKDVDEQISDIQRRSPQDLAPFAQDPAKMAQFRQELQSALALENLRIKDVALSPAQVAAYYAANTRRFVLPQQIQATTVVTQNSVDAATAADLLKQKTPVDVLARQPRLLIVGINGYNPDLGTLPAGLKTQINGFVQKAPVGAVKTFSLAAKPGSTFYLTLQVTNTSRQMLPSLAQIKTKVERQARLDHAPPAAVEMARLYKAAKPTFNSDRYAAYFSALQGASADSDGGKKTASDR